MIAARPAQSRCTARRQLLAIWPIIYGRSATCRLDSCDGRNGTGFASGLFRLAPDRGGANGQDEIQRQVDQLRGQQSWCWPPVSPTPSRPQDDAVVEAVWKPQRVNFVYRGYSTLYSCPGLQEKLEKILRTVGARGRIELRAYSCDDELRSRASRCALTSPVEATPENIEQLTTYDTRRADRARARRATRERRGSAAVPAVWKTISISSSREMRLAPGIASWCSNCAGTSCREWRCRSSAIRCAARSSATSASRS